jgi:DNA-binding MarR family transcriptional regulator
MSTWKHPAWQDSAVSGSKAAADVAMTAPLCTVYLQRKPILTIPATAEQLSLSAPTVAKIFQHMVKLGMVRETTGKQRHRLFAYHHYLDILNQETELPKVGR